MKKTLFITLFLLLSLFLGTSSAGEVTMFGPKQYVRTTGDPNVYTDTFSAIDGEATLTVKNGDWDGSKRITDAISSASVSINGVEIFGPDDFSQQVYILEATINLAEGNSLLVELASNPGSYLTIEVVQYIEPPTVTISADPEAIHINETSTLSWTSTNADSATIDQGIGVVDVSGSTTVSPTETKIYTITVINLGGTDTDSVTVTKLNTAPVADPQPVITDEDIEVLITLTGSDVDGDPLTFQVTTGPTNGTLTGTAPDLTYTPGTDWYGTDTFTFTVNDGTDDSAPATVTITVKSVNDPPVAVDDTATTDEDIAVTTDDVLANDTDVEEDTLSVSIFTQPANGTAVYNGDGIFTYTPNANYYGTDSFTYTTDDGNGGSATATVTVTVAPINDPPEILPIEGQVMDEGSTLDVTVSASDVDTESLILSVSGLPPFATLTDNGDGTRSIAFEPGYEDAGIYPMTATVSDGELSDSDEFILTVNHVNRPPVLTPIDDQIMDEVATLQVPISSTDPDGDPLTLLITGLPSFANFTDNGDGTGSISFDAGYEDSGIYSMSVTVSDTELTNSDEFVITVNDVIADPEITSSPIITGAEDTPYLYDVEATDPGGYELTYSLIAFPNGMTINSSSGLIEWTPNQVQVGDHDVTVFVENTKGLSATQQFIISVANVNTINWVDWTQQTASDNVIGNISFPESQRVDVNYHGTIFDVQTSGGTNWWVENVPPPYTGNEVITNAPPASDIIKIEDPDVTNKITFSRPVINPVMAFVSIGSDSRTVYYNFNSPFVLLSEGSGWWGDGWWEKNGNTLYGREPHGVIQFIGMISEISWTNYPYECWHGFTVGIPEEFNSPLPEVPIANAGLDQDVFIDDTVFLDGTASNDPYGSTITYNWTMIDKPDESSAFLSDPLSSTPSFIADKTGTYVIQLIVNNGTWDSPVDRVKISASPPTVTVPDVINIPLSDAEAAITAAKLIVGNITEGYSSNVPAGSIISQSPAAGTSVAGHTSVDLVVSLGDVADRPVITSSPVVNGGEDTPYLYDVEATDPLGYELTYALMVYPDGMTINSSSGLIEWTPNQVQVGDHDVTVYVENTGGAYATQQFIISVADVNTIDWVDWTNRVGTSDTVVGNISFPVSQRVDVVYQGPLLDAQTRYGTYYWVENSPPPYTGNEVVTNAPPTIDAILLRYPGDTNKITFSRPVVKPVMALFNVGSYSTAVYYNFDSPFVVLGEGNGYYGYGWFSHMAGNVLRGYQGNGVIQFTGTISEITWTNHPDYNGHGFTIGIPEEFNSPLPEVPIANAGSDQDVFVGNTTLLDGTASNDPYGSTITYSWTIIDRPDESSAFLSDRLSSTPSFIADKTGTYVIRLIVNNGTWNSPVDTVEIRASVSAFTVPDVVSMSQADAEAAIAAAQLVVGNITEEYSSIVPEGSIISQSPAAGTSVLINTSVDLVVSLGVEEDVDPPTVSISVDLDPVNLGDTVTVTVVSSDNAGVVNETLTVNGTALPLTGDEAVYVADTVGPILAEAVATDAAGLSGSASLTFLVIDSTDTNPPVVSLDDEDCVDVTDRYTITGSVSDDAGTFWKLQSREKGAETWTTLAEGFTSSLTGDLGVFDPTVLRNGVHEIRIYAEDTNNNTAAVEGCMVVDGELKVGQVIIPVEDINIPQQGFPLSIVREYDSRDGGEGDFGPGWNLPSSDVKPTATTPLGENWDENGVGEPVPTYYLFGTTRHEVVIRFSDSDILKFKLTPSPESSVLYPFNCYMPLTISFEPIDDTQGSLEALDFDPDAIFCNGQLIDLAGALYDPKKFRLTRVDGTKYVISENGIESMTDPYGHTITYGANGITHSSGASLSFSRGEGNRIETITDQFGGIVEYHYDEDGYLSEVVQTKVSGAINMISKYGYATGVFEKPVLKTITAPDGTELGQFEYDSSGRMTALIDANGNRIIYGYDVPNHQQVITDRLGHDTLYEYDNEGNVTTKTDPMGQVSLWTYDENGHKLTETDPLGNTTDYSHDVYGNMLTETDPLNNTTTYTYNAKNQVLTSTDALGNTTTNTYDANGNLLTTTDPEGGVTTHTYDANGNLASTTDALGNTTTYTYDANGNMISETDPLGNTTTYTYDGYGNKLTQTVTRTTLSGPVTMTTAYEYDALDRVIKETDPDGYYEQMEYNDIDKMTARVDKKGNLTGYLYDPQGNQTGITYADGTTESFTYDAEGNRLTSTDRAGRTTGYDYDLLNRLIRTTYPDGSFTEMEYDAAGRLFASIDENGNRTEFGYDAAGRRTSVTDALSNVTTFAYDGAGNQVSMTDANSKTTTYEYDKLNRRIKTIYPDVTFSTVAYDALGRKVSETDQAGNTTQFDYDAMGRLTVVTDALSHLTYYGYDEVGNKIYQTDPNGNTTYWAYDNLGRVVTHTLPLGMSESFTYDANGNMLTKTDFNGDTTTYVYDVCCGRLLNKIYPDAPEVSFTYTATGQRETVTDARGLTTYTYDLRDRVLSVLNPDGSILSYTYAATRNRTSVTTPVGTTTYTFDALNRLKTVTDPDGNITTYSYDAVGNRASIVYPNGTVTSYQYDTLNRLTYLGNRKSASEIISSYTYTLGPAGNRLQVVENTGRVVDYSYDTLYRLIQEDITDPVLGNETISYTYDAFGNRLTKTDSTGTIIYTYDVNDRLLTEVGPDFSYSYSYDDNGNTILKTDGVDSTDYAYDFENRLVSVQTGTSQVTYANDADGIRIKSTVDGVVTNFLVDKNRPYAQVLEETDDTSSLIVDYVYGDDLISQHRGGGDYFYLYDGQMSTRQLTNDIEDVANEYIYDAFGVILDQTGLVENNYRYTGEQYDPNAGFYYLRARYYNHNIGRFVTQDPWQGNVFEPVSLHKYLYANANPVMFRDPSGLWTLQDTMSTIAISATLASIMLPSSTGMPVYTGYVNLFDLQFGKGLSAGHILYGGFITAQITAYSKNKRHAWQGDFNVYMLGLGTGVSFSRFSDLIPFKTYTRTSIPDFEGFGRITTIEFAYVTPTFGIAVITLPNGKTIGPEEGIYAGYGWKMSGYVVLAYWDLKGIPRQIY